jgi:hypothetical protein
MLRVCFFAGSRFPVPGCRFPGLPAAAPRGSAAGLFCCLFPVPASPSRGMPRVCFSLPVPRSLFPNPGSRIPPLRYVCALNDVAKKQHFPPGGIAVKKVTLQVFSQQHDVWPYQQRQKDEKGGKTPSSSGQSGSKSVKTG